MQLKNFKLYSNYVELFLSDNSVSRLWLNDWSAKIVFRYKINTISNVRHPGICLGYDQTGNWYYMHNHFEHGHAVIEIHNGFVKGQKLFLLERQSKFDQLSVIEKGLNEILLKKKYDFYNNNCQSYVNRICFNEDKSEAVNNWTSGFAAVLLLVFAGVAIKNSK